MARRFGLGVATGLLVGLLTSLSPVVAVLVILIVFVASFRSVLRHADPARTMMLAGTLVGAGLFLAYGAFNTIAACANTEDFCGNANVAPFGALAATTLLAGAFFATAVLIRRD